MNAPPFIPWWARLLARVPYGANHRCVFDVLIMMGFWDMDDGDWYVNGRWNWRCWETWERQHARLVAGGWSAPMWMPWFPRAMRRLFS